MPEKGNSQASWLVGGGEMGEFVRSKDWSNTPLGPVDGWPEALRTTVNLALASTFPIAIVWGPQRVQIYNDGLRPICGDKPPRAMGQDFKECWESAWPAIGDAFERASIGETAFLENEQVFLDRFGYLEETFFTFSFSPIRDESGEVAGLFHPVNEVTSRVLAERRSHVLREVYDEAVDARTIEEAGRVLLHTLSRHQADIPFAVLYEVDEIEKRARLLGAANVEPGSAVAPANLTLDDSSSVWPVAASRQSCSTVEVTDLADRFDELDCGPFPETPRSALILPILAGSDRPVALLIVGVSARRALDEDYRVFYRMLQDAATSAIGNARTYQEEMRRREALAALDRAKTVFFSNVSHEFRTPLTLIEGPLVEILDDEATPSQTRATLAVAHRNTLRLLKLVNSLLDFSRIEAGREEAQREPTDLGALTSDLASNFRSACEVAGLTLRVETPSLGEPIYVDRDKWEKVVLNLISNAFKFTLSGEINVSLSLSGSDVLLQVRDTGVGIPAEQLPLLFERFHRVEGAGGRTHEGTGIGLALVHELVKLHDGTVEIESEPGVGTVVSVRLPRGAPDSSYPIHNDARPDESTTLRAAPFVEEALRWLPETDRFDVAVATAADGSQAESSRGKVLLADDNADMRNYVRNLLSEQMEVRAVADGEAALAEIERFQPDLVLADVMMPGLDGIQLVRLLRSRVRTKGLPVILLSARAGEQARVEGLRAGADDYIFKPFSARELRARVLSQIDLARVRREGEQRFRVIADTAPAVLWITDDSHRCTFVSSRWQEITGQAPEDALGDGWVEPLHPDDRKRVWEALQIAGRDQTAFLQDYRLRHRDGEYRWMIGSGRARFDERGAFVGFVGSVIEAHERKRAEQELREADRRKDVFLAVLAHELRNPLAPIRTGLQILSSAPPDPKVAARAVAVMERQTQHLTRLIDDLMDVSRITQGKLQLQKTTVTFADVINAALESTRPLIDAGGHELHLELPSEPIPVWGDLTRLAQVFANLVGNAAKYTPAGGTIQLVVDVQGDEVVTSVTDTGVGIADEHMGELFQMFAQLDHSRGGRSGGLGIGLTIVKSLVERHDGTVSVSSGGPGQGATFTVTLPIFAPDHDASEPAESSLDSSSDQLRVLIVDDNRDAAEMLQLAIEIGGHDVRTAFGGADGVAQAEIFRPHVIFMDLGMPEVDGYQAARQIRQAEWGRPMVIVALTGWGQRSVVEAVEDAGFDHHLVKPATVSQVTEILRATAP